MTDVLGVRIDTLERDTAIGRISTWIDQGLHGHYVAFTNVHMIVEAYRNREFRAVLRDASMCLPDGMPLVWAAKARGHKAQRLSGPDFMLEFLARTAGKGYRHFFYGGSPTVVEELVSVLRTRFPDLEVAGWLSPPFRELTSEEEEAIVRQINDARPDILWVALGCPKQEKWMGAHRQRLSIPVMFGVGQAFNVHSGHLRRAPVWMRQSGLEWLFRLMIEPGRLWRRYLFTNTVFIVCLLAEVLGWKHSD